jgi:hypothetical protein
MKKRYVVVQRGERGGMCYCKDTDTGARPSLHTRDRQEAERLVKHKNEAIETPHINRKIGMAYLSAADPVRCRNSSAQMTNGRIPFEFMRFPGGAMLSPR